MFLSERQSALELWGLWVALLRHWSIQGSSLKLILWFFFLRPVRVECICDPFCFQNSECPEVHICF